MINKILMELYDEYIKEKNDKKLVEFAIKTFGNGKTKNLFIGCSLIMFNRTYCFEARYDCTRENLLDIVYASKIDNGNLIRDYIERINTVKGIRKYFEGIYDNIDEYADNIINYLDGFKPKFSNYLENKKC